MSVQDGIYHVLKSLYTANGGISISTINVTDGMFVMNGTTSVPKSILCLVLDKVRQVSVPVDQLQYPQLVPNKSLSQELNNQLCLILNT